MISEQDKTRVLMASDIVEVIEDFVPLKKAGQNFKGLCPFHNEKTPSFTVSPAKQIYHCFGCSESGGVINFLMTHEHLSYPEAVRQLAQRYNIEIEEKEYTAEEKEARGKAESFSLILKMAADWFTDQFNNSEKGKAIAQSYVKERGINSPMVEKFSLGYCPDDGRMLAEHAKAKGYDQGFLEELGLVKDSPRGAYDVYRGRLIFPIRDLGGKIIAFGARALKSGQQPKYINSPEHLIYNKSRTLYALHEARKSAAKNDNVFVVEGYTDVIALHQAGVENVVATCGTSVTEDHIARLRHITKNVTVVFDGDVAGQKAALRTVKNILRVGLNARVISLPEGEDPDTIAKSLSSHDLQVFLEESQKDFLQFIVQTQLEAAGNDPVKKSEVSKTIIETVSEIPDNVKRAFYIQEVARVLKVAEPTVAKEISKVRIKTTYRDRGEREVIEQELAPAEGKQAFKKIDLADSDEQERDIIRLLLFHGNRPYDYEGENEAGEIVKAQCTFADFIFDELSYNGINFQDPLYDRVLTAIQKQYFSNNKIEPTMLAQSEDIELAKCCAAILSTEIIVSENWKKKYQIAIRKEEERPQVLMESSMNRLKLKAVLHNRKLLKEKLRNSPSIEDQESILGKIHTLDQVKRELSNYFGTTVF
ncbi:MAG: DNA primase [Flavobacteriales bacterium]|nr:DNA primase [Flavobacteriales bacterium]